MLEEIEKYIARKTFSVKKASGYVCFGFLVWKNKPIMVGYDTIRNEILNVSFLEAEESIEPDEMEFLEELVFNYLSFEKELERTQEKLKFDKEKERQRIIAEEKVRKEYREAKNKK